MAVSRQDVQDLVDELVTEYPVDVFLYPVSEGVRLDKIWVDPAARGRGTGSRVMQRIVDWADDRGVILVLTAEGEPGGPSTAKLKAWYRSFGFVPNTGRHKDFAFTDAMIRRPAVAANPDVAQLRRRLLR